MEHRRPRPGAGPLLIVLLLAALVVLVERRFGSGVGEEVRPVVASPGVVARSAEAEGWAVRDEVILTAPGVGRVTRLVEEGERVPRGGLVAEIYGPGADAARTQELEQVRAEIAALRREVAERAEAYRARDRALKEEIAALNADLAAAAAAGDDGKARQIEEELRRREEERARLARHLQAGEDAAATREGVLTAREEQLRAELLRSAVLVRAPAPGVVSFTFDGLEPFLTLERVPQLTREQLARVTPRFRRVEDGAEVAAGEPVARLIDSYSFYLLLFFQPGERLPPIQAGQRVFLQELGGSATYWATVRQALVHDEERAALVQLDRFEARFSFYRRGRFRVDWERYEGLVVPVSAVVERRGRTGVYLWIDGQAVFAPVRVQGGVGSRVAVQGIPAGARVVSNPAALREDA